jgi:desulfoferrodoxin (superoxide reductase-like protein)
MLTRRHFTVLAGLGLPLLLPATSSAQIITPRPDWRATGPREGTLVDASSEGISSEHVPRITLPARPRLMRPFDLVVRIGENHPQRADHFIAWVEVAYEGEILFITDLSPSVPFPVVRIPVLLRREGTLTVRAHCTRHGTFMLAQALRPS